MPKKSLDLDKLLSLKLEGKSNQECSKILNYNQNLIGQKVKLLIEQSKLNPQNLKRESQNKRKVVTEKNRVSCLNCGKEKLISLKVNISKKHFCNRGCEREYYSKNRYMSKKCELCGIEYETQNENQKYCSNKCKMDACRATAIKNAKEKYTTEKRSRVLKEVWAKNKEAILEKRNTEEYREKISTTSSERFKDKNFKEKFIQSVKEAWSDERRERAREIVINRINQNNRVITRPNVIVGEILLRLGIDFKYEQPLGTICRPDIKISEDKYIEIFGDYWHCNPDVYSTETTHSQQTN